MVDMSISLPTNKLLETQQLALSLFQMQSFTVCQVMCLVGQGHFYANRYAQFCGLCHVIQNDLLTIILLLTHFILFTFILQLCIRLGDYLSCSSVHFHYGFLYLMW